MLNVLKPLNTPIRDWRGQRVWIIGASSGIGAALAGELLKRGARVAVSARREAGLREAVAGRGAQSLILPLDVTDASAFAPALMTILSAWDGLDLAIFCAGTYRPMRAWTLDADAARQTFETNVLAVMSGVTALVPLLSGQGNGGIALVASVAGYRGLPRALAYGASKAALINFAEGLYLDLHPRGIGVTLINPGFVATPLTAQNEFTMPALISPAQAVEYILAGFAHGDFEIHFPRRFSGFLKLLRLLPARLYFWLLKNVAKDA